jgi:hypothetical protein
MDKPIESGLPTKAGWYYAWEIGAGLSSKAYWDEVKWIFPDDWPTPFKEMHVDYWREL